MSKEEKDLNEARGEKAAPTEQPPRQAPPAAGGTPPPKVLVAEDNKVVRRGLTSFLVNWGYTPVEAETGDEAMQAIEDNPDLRLAILDWNLPGLSGMQVCQRIRTRPGGDYIYIIMFSARKSAQEQITALNGGADDYLTKPSKPSILRARLGVGRRIIETALNRS